MVTVLMNNGEDIASGMDLLKHYTRYVRLLWSQIELLGGDWKRYYFL